MINSVLGPVDFLALGMTLMHEHLSIVDPAMRQAFPHWLDRDAVIQHAVEDVNRAPVSNRR